MLHRPFLGSRSLLLFKERTTETRAILIGKRILDRRLNRSDGTEGKGCFREESIVLLHGTDETEIAVLDQVKERKAWFLHMALVAGGNGHHQTQVGLDQLGA